LPIAADRSGTGSSRSICALAGLLTPELEKYH
jgi:hypothetical protein